MDELRHLLELLVAEDRPLVPISNEDGSLPIQTYVVVLAATASGMKPSLVIAQAPMEVCLEPGRSQRRLDDEGIKDLALIEEDPCKG